MKLTFLGTGTSQGIPIITCKCEVCSSIDSRDQRLRTSVLIEVDGQNIVIDAGPDFRQQMLRANVSRLDAVLLTHEHKDHIAGLDDVRPFNFNQSMAMPIYCESRVSEALVREYAYVFSDKKYPGIPQFDLRLINEVPFVVNKISVIPIRVLHMKLPVLGFRIYDLTYITDASYIASEEIEKIKGTRVLVVNTLRKEAHYSHFNLEQTLDLIHKVKPEKAYLTHIGHQMGLYASVQKELPDNVELAYDMLSVEF